MLFYSKPYFCTKDYKCPDLGICPDLGMPTCRVYYMGLGLGLVTTQIRATREIKCYALEILFLYTH